MCYKVFVRNWWRYDRNGSLVPDPGARWYTIDRVVTEAQAQARCKEYQATHNPGPLSRKAEYTWDGPKR